MERTQHGITLKHEIPAVSGLVCIGRDCFLRDFSLQFVALQLDCNAFCSPEKALTQELSGLTQAEVPTLLQFCFAFILGSLTTFFDHVPPHIHLEGSSPQAQEERWPVQVQEGNHCLSRA